MMTLPLGIEHFLTMLLVAALPTGIWRIGAVFLARRLSNQSEVFEWVRFVATALLAGVVAKLLANPSGVLALAPLWGRMGAITLGFISFMLCKRSVFVGVVVGEVMVITSVYLTAP